MGLYGDNGTENGNYCLGFKGLSLGVRERLDPATACNEGCLDITDL